jgi:hypothetical protein
MKLTLLLLAAMIGAACGAELGAKIMGVTTIGDPCSASDEEILYEECVVDVAVAMGVNLSRRLELRGNRELQTGSTCNTCCQNCPSCIMSDCYPLGTWCFTYCSISRRLTVADEHVHTERFLYTKGQIQKAANECLDLKIEEGYTCLGKPEDLTIKIFLSE